MKEGKLGELVIVLIVVVLLMAAFLDHFFKNEAKVSNTGFHAVVVAFASKVNLVHAQWFMDKQPKIVALEQLGGQNASASRERIPVNSKGWVDANYALELATPADSACQQIWHHVIGAPMMVMKTPVIAIEINENTEQGYRICRYQSPQGVYFDYNTGNGKVSELFVVEKQVLK